MLFDGKAEPEHESTVHVNNVDYKMSIFICQISSLGSAHHRVYVGIGLPPMKLS